MLERDEGSAAASFACTDDEAAAAGAADGDNPGAVTF